MSESENSLFMFSLINVISVNDMLFEDEIAERAVSRFLKEFNCAESVSLTLAEVLGDKSGAIPKVATPFGGGIGREGSLCGCIAGGLISIGLKYGRLEPSDDKEKAYELSANFCRVFEEKFGSKFCYELTGCDFHTEEGLRKFESMRKEKCVNFVREAVKILLKMLC